ncbi:hypothetical protein H6F87_18560 [Cyanobacteria bacterium FACHB-502]|nr:hypothetical protein [Cyanobacteria bacterium FACHB-502]
MAESSKAIDSLCFCTSAFGEKYNLMAKLLAQDLKQFTPDASFVIYTDRPHWFEGNSNVCAVKHSCRGVLPYHERRFAIWHALSIASTVIYLDADVRICAPVPKTLSFLPGLTARSCGSFQKHIQEQFNKYPNSSKLHYKKSVIERMARRVGVDIDRPDLKFINEFLFTVNACEERELEFLKIWGELAIYADTLGMHQHPTYAMALAAIKSGFPIHHSEMKGLDFFDDRIEKVRIREGQSTPEAKAQYFHQQSSIEQGNHNLLQRSAKRVAMQSAFLYHRTRVQLFARMRPSSLINYPAFNPNP